MELDPANERWQTVYKLMIGSIVPRPVGWVSSLGPAGVRNLAPFSFFNAICGNPPHVLFCPMIRGTDGNAKDSLENVRASGEFVINIVTETLAEAMNTTSVEVPPGVDEFKLAGLTAVPSAVVQPPRVGESPVHFECRAVKIVDLSELPGGGSVVIGRVVHIHVDPAVMLGGDKIDLGKLQPIGRLAGASYCRVTNLFNIERPPSRLTNLGSGFEEQA
jgi:flavin reductase (DIM6/NTAB) family NADH-FMN oxidoreductase RutF